MTRAPLLVLIPLLFLISACSNRIGTFSAPGYSTGSHSPHPSLPAFNTALFQNHFVPISITAITELNEAQQRDFFRYFNNPINHNTPANQRAYNYLSLVIDQLSYSDETLTAEQTLLKQSGNCLSLTNLTKAIAKLANVNIAFHLMENNLVFSFQDSFLIKTDHIRAVLEGRAVSTRPNESNSLFSTRRDLRVDYFPTDHLRYVDGMSNEMQTSLYFSNLAVDFILKEQYDKAFYHAAKALEISRNNASALNVVAIAHRRRGDYETAEKVYLHGIEHLRDKVTFLKNYTTLLESQGREEDARLIYKKIVARNDVDPWHWIRSGLNQYQQREFITSIDHFNRALAVAPNLDYVHFYLARAHLAMGRNKKSETHLKKAIEHAKKSSTLNKYKAKLYALKTN